jgi:hypothetical protein
MVNAVVTGKKHTQMTPRGALVSAGYGCYIVPGLMLGALMPPDTACTLKVAQQAYDRWRTPRYPDELWMDVARVQAEFNEPYYKAYHEPCVPAPVKKKHKKKQRRH